MTDPTAVLPHQTVSLMPDHPTFANEIAGTLSVHSQYVLHGNLRDEFLVAGEIMSLHKTLWTVLRPSGFEALITYDQIDGIGVYPPNEPAAAQAVQRVLGSNVVGRRPSPERLRVHLAKTVGVAEQPPLEAGGSSSRSGPAVAPALRPAARVAVVVDHAARLVRAPGQLSEEERDFFLLCQKLASAAKAHTFPGTRQAPLHNPVLWLVDGERDLPVWFTTGAESIRTVAVGLPTLEHRLHRARSLMPSFPRSAQDPSAARSDPVEVFANRTEGMTLQAMRRITLLARDRELGADRVADAVRIYKLGVDDNPWRRNSVRTQIIKGQEVISDRVKGQERAVSKTLDILKRAALGLSGAQASTSNSRPRGVLFFAGPTGVGKTELAKQVAQLLFGDAEAYLRFDMSEFSAEHAADRLTGAPPGYVGFEAGGELTGAVRRRPFQVVLFDEIEKAHPLLLDKFLQILEDGRLTDGQGVTTYFTECVLIFTSNLGIVHTDENGQRTLLVRPGMPYGELEQTVKKAIRDHFTTKLGRPELLNRFGDNIVIFDFIDLQTSRGIFGGQLGNVIRKVHDELGVEVEVTPEAERQLEAMCTADPDNGGRGIGNQLESALINPLARLLFQEDAQPGDRVVVTGCQAGHGTAGATLWANVEKGPPMSMRCPEDPNEVFADEESFCTEHMCPLRPVIADGPSEPMAASTPDDARPMRPARKEWSTAVCWYCGQVSPVATNVECLSEGCGRSLTPPPLYLKFPDGEVELDRGEQAVLGRQGDYAHVFRSFANVSRRQATIGVDEDGRAWINPSPTPNGTFVNGDELPPSLHRTLRCGDVIRFAANAEGTVTLYDL